MAFLDTLLEPLTSKLEEKGKQAEEFLTLHLLSQGAIILLLLLIFFRVRRQ